MSIPIPCTAVQRNPVAAHAAASPATGCADIISITGFMDAVLLEEVEARLRKALTHLGAKVFNYGAGHIRAAEGPVIERMWSSMDPAWIKRYTERRYHRLDRLVREAFIRIRPFTFKEIFDNPPETKEQIEMETEFSYRNGFVCPIHSPQGRFGILSVAFDTPVIGNDTESFDLIARVACVAALAHDRAEYIHFTESRKRVGLTNQELTCLRWAAAGKTLDEIAHILSISERTVRKHLVNVRAKFGVSTRAQAVSKAISYGIISA